MVDVAPYGVDDGANPVTSSLDASAEGLTSVLGGRVGIGPVPANGDEPEVGGGDGSMICAGGDGSAGKLSWLRNCCKSTGEAVPELVAPLEPISTDGTGVAMPPRPVEGRFAGEASLVN